MSHSTRKPKNRLGFTPMERIGLFVLVIVIIVLIAFLLGGALIKDDSGATAKLAPPPASGIPQGAECMRVPSEDSVQGDLICEEPVSTPPPTVTVPDYEPLPPEDEIVIHEGYALRSQNNPEITLHFDSTYAGERWLGFLSPCSVTPSPAHTALIKDEATLAEAMVMTMPGWYSVLQSVMHEPQTKFILAFDVFLVVGVPDGLSEIEMEALAMGLDIWLDVHRPCGELASSPPIA